MCVAGERGWGGGGDFCANSFFFFSWANFGKSICIIIYALQLLLFLPNSIVQTCFYNFHPPPHTHTRDQIVGSLIFSRIKSNESEKVGSKVFVYI